MILKIIGTDITRVFGEIKNYEYYGGTIEFETKDGERYVIPIDNYQTQDYSDFDNSSTSSEPPMIDHVVTDVFIMNDQGQTIERIK